jgi:putative ABC transport system substrate-binding protein
MKRREFIAGLGSTTAWPVVARAQGEPVRRIGILTGYSEDESEIKARLGGFRQGLERLSWFEGRNIHIDYRYAMVSAEATQALAKELVALHPEVILAHTPTIVGALQRETRTIPIVFVGIIDAVAQGLVASLAHPGGNATGLMQFESSLAGKWLSMLKQIAPNLMRIALVTDRSTGLFENFINEAEAAARSLGIELVPMYVEDVAEIERSFESFACVPNGGLVLLPSIPNGRYRDLIAMLAARFRLPAIHTGRYYVEAGGLMSYGIDRVDEFRRAARYVDRILRGEKPADLVQAPVKYETVLNLKTAKALGLTVPETLLATADEVIQ